MSKGYHKRIEDFYAPFIKKADPKSHHASAWAQRADQILRMTVMSGMISFFEDRPTTLLDVGCGVGDYKGYLKFNAPETAVIDYTGIDLCDGMIKKGAILYPDARLATSTLMEWRQDIDYDWVVASGTFNSPGYEGEGTVVKNVKRMFDLCKVGVAFNFLESCSKRDRIKGLCTHSGANLYRECKKVTDRVVLLSDYNIHEADSTIIMFNDEFILDAIDDEIVAEHRRHCIQQQKDIAELKKRQAKRDKEKEKDAPDLKVLDPDEPKK